MQPHSYRAGKESIKHRRKSLTRFNVCLVAFTISASALLGIHSSFSIDRQSASSAADEYSGSPNVPSWNTQYDDIAIAVKTGAALAHKRIPIVMLTYLQHFPLKNILIISDADEPIGAPYSSVDVLGAKDRSSSIYDLDVIPAGELLGDNDEKNQAAPISRSVDSAGWQTDRLKFFSGFRKLRSHQPKASWYVMVDDDTYLHMPNLVDYLSGLNASQPLYIGGPRSFYGCGLEPDQLSSYYFAYGGSGIVISRAAMDLLEGVSESCAEKYKSCWAGDVAFGICFHDDLKVEMTSKYNIFHGETPYTLAWREWPYLPCERPLSFHHLLPKHMTMLYSIEERNRERNGGMVTHADIISEFYRAVPGARPVGFDGISVNGKEDLIMHNVASVGECLTKALASTTTKVWSFDHKLKNCIVGNGLPVFEAKDDFIGGVLPGRYQCT